MYKLILSLLLFFVLASLTQGQMEMTRVRFERLDVSSRAAYFEREMAAAASKHNVDPKLLWTIGFLETRFRPWLTSPKGAKGMMQFMPATAKKYSLANPYEPIASIHSAAKYVRYLSDRFDGRIVSILAAYNAGEGTVSAYLSGRTLRVEGKVINASAIRTESGIPPYLETRNYVRNGLNVYHWLESRRMFDRNVSVAISSEKIQETDEHKVHKTEKPPTVFYDARTGSRYSLVDPGRVVKLAQSGAVVISPSVRSIISSSARTNYFAATKRRKHGASEAQK